MFCKTCGKEVNDQAVICPHCGCAIKEVSAPAPVKASKNLNVLGLVGFILALVSLLIALFGSIATAGLICSIIGLVQANKKNQGKGLAIAGICVAAGSLAYTIYAYIVILALLA